MAEEPRQSFGRVLVGPMAHTDHAGDRGQDERRIGQRRQVDKPGPAGEALAHLLRRGNGQPGFADSTRSGQRQQAGLRAAEEVAKPRDLLLAVDQPGWLRRERVEDWQFACATTDGPRTGWPRDRVGSLHARPPFQSASWILTR